MNFMICVHISSIFMLFYIVLSIYICKHAFTYPENWP